MSHLETHTSATHPGLQRQVWGHMLLYQELLASRDSDRSRAGWLSSFMPLTNFFLCPSTRPSPGCPLCPQSSLRHKPSLGGSPVLIMFSRSPGKPKLKGTPSEPTGGLRKPPDCPGPGYVPKSYRTSPCSKQKDASLPRLLAKTEWSSSLTGGIGTTLLSAMLASRLVLRFANFSGLDTCALQSLGQRWRS